METSDYLTVGRLTKYLKRKFDADPYLGRVYLTGEISNFKPRANSHQYFSLKDDSAKISAVMFKGMYQKLTFQPEEGMKVLVIGRVSLYEPSGNYQIYVDKMEPDGIGALYQAYEKLKKELHQEGLFQERLKQPLVKYPKRIAVVTSPSGSVVRDIMTTVKRRYPIAQLVVFPTLVQGDKAAADIVRQIKAVDALGDFDTMIVARGGGSIEDLWPFNTEEVARATFEAKTPIISSIGHETDTTIIDMVADVRAATPTAAAELAVPVLSEELLKIKEKQTRLLQAFKNQLTTKQQRHQRVMTSFIFKQPQRLYESFSLKNDELNRRLEQSMTTTWQGKEKEFRQLQQRLYLLSPEKEMITYQEKLKHYNKQLRTYMMYQLKQSQESWRSLTNSLDMLSPLKTMTRGYSYVTDDQKIIKSVSEVKESDELVVHLSDGTLDVTVRAKTKGEN